MRLTLIVLLALLLPIGGLAARGESPAAFDGRCIPAGGVAPPSNIPDILGRRALPAGRLGCLSATPAFHHGLLGLAGQATPPAQLQPLPAGTRVSVDPPSVRVDDGDTVTIRWPRGNEEIVRVLGIDAPETRHLEHDIPFDQPWGREAAAFARGAMATAGRVALVRAETRDAYGRTLAYLFLDDDNYSVLIVEARLAYETVSAFGDNGLPAEAAAVTAAAERAGPLPFEPPHVYRARLRKVAAWMKAQGLYPEQ